MKTPAAPALPALPAGLTATLIDEYGELDRQAKLSDGWKSKSDRYEALKRQIKACYDEQSAEAEFTAAGQFYEVQVSARTNESSLKSPMDLYRAFKKGLPEFLAWVKPLVTKKSVAEGLGLGDKQAEAYFEKHLTGSRRLTAVLRAAPTAKKAA